MHSPVRWCKQVVTNPPDVAIVVTEEAGCCEEEQSPATLPKMSVLAIDGFEQRFYLVDFAVEICQPIESRLLIMLARPTPILFNGEALPKAIRQIISGHDAAGEEMMRNPVCRILVVETIGAVLVRENMQEQFSVR